MTPLLAPSPELVRTPGVLSDSVALAFVCDYVAEHFLEQARAAYEAKLKKTHGPKALNESLVWLRSVEVELRERVTSQLMAEHAELVAMLRWATPLRVAGWVVSEHEKASKQ